MLHFMIFKPFEKKTKTKKKKKKKNTQKKKKKKKKTPSIFEEYGYLNNNNNFIVVHCKGRNRVIYWHTLSLLGLLAQLSYAQDEL